MIDRTSNTVWSSNDPKPFRQSHETNADHVFVTTERRANFEYDYKRRLVNPVRQYVPLREGEVQRLVQHIACDSVPWGSIEEFNETRDQFEQWRLKANGILRTMEDWDRWQDFRGGAAASKAGVRRGRGGIVTQARRMFIRAYVRGDWGLPSGSYQAAADALTAEGYPTTEQDFKNARQRHKEPPPENIIPADAEGVPDLVATLRRLWPDFDSSRLLKPAG